MWWFSEDDVREEQEVVEEIVEEEEHRGESEEEQQHVGGAESESVSVEDILVGVGAENLLRELEKRGLTRKVQEYVDKLRQSNTTFAVLPPGSGKSFIGLAVAVCSCEIFGSRIVYIIAPTKNVQEVYLKVQLDLNLLPEDRYVVLPIYGMAGGNDERFRFTCPITGRPVTDPGNPCQVARRIKRRKGEVKEVVIGDKRFEIKHPHLCPELRDIVHLPHRPAEKSGEGRLVTVRTFMGEAYFLSGRDLRSLAEIAELCPYYRQFALLYYYLRIGKRVICVVNVHAFTKNRHRLPVVSPRDCVIFDEVDSYLTIVESVMLDREKIGLVISELDKLTSHEDLYIRTAAKNCLAVLSRLEKLMSSTDYAKLVEFDIRRFTNEVVQAVALAYLYGRLGELDPETAQSVRSLVFANARPSTRRLFRSDFTQTVQILWDGKYLLLYREVDQPVNNLPPCKVFCMTATPPTESEIRVFLRRLYRAGEARFSIAKLFGKVILHVTGLEFDLTRGFFDHAEQLFNRESDIGLDKLAEYVIRLGKIIELARRHGPVYVPLHHLDPYIMWVLRFAKFGEKWASTVENSEARSKILEAAKIAKELSRYIETSRTNRGLYTRFEGYVGANASQGEKIPILISSCVARGTSLENTAAIVFIKRPMPNPNLPLIRIKAERTGRTPMGVADEECLKITLQFLGRVLRRPDKVVHVYTLDTRMLRFMEDTVSQYVDLEVVVEPTAKIAESEEPVAEIE